MDDRSNTEWFDDDAFWIDQYPLMFSDQRFAEAAAQVEQLIRLLPASAREVLDVGCGPGRFAVPLAKRGYSVTGVDRTQFLLDRGRHCAASAGVEVDWVHQDMRDFVRPQAFDVVISMMTSFGYFLERGDDLRVLSNMYSSLRTGGCCVIDLKSKELVARTLQPTTAEVMEDGTIMIKRSQVVGDWTRVCNELIIIRGEEPQRRFRFDSNLYSGQELRDCLTSAGFEEVTLFGDLEGGEFGLHAKRLVALGRK